MFARWLDRGPAHRILLVGLLEQHVDERAALEVVAAEPLAEDVEDREQASPAGSAARCSTSSRSQARVQRSSRISRKASARSSFDGKLR